MFLEEDGRRGFSHLAGDDSHHELIEIRLAGIDLDAAKSAADDASLLWSKAQAAFASGSMDEAVRTAQEVKSRVEALATTLKLDLQSAKVPSLTMTAVPPICAAIKAPLSVSRRTLTCPGRFI